jgi:hypothetical protein
VAQLQSSHKQTAPHAPPLCPERSRRAGVKPQTKRPSRLPPPSHLRYPPPMGLDAVELILRAEELYSTRFTDDEAAQVRTVNDFYRLICSKLNLTPLPNPETPPTLPKISELESLRFLRRRYTPLPHHPRPFPGLLSPSGTSSSPSTPINKQNRGPTKPCQAPQTFKTPATLTKQAT